MPLRLPSRQRLPALAALSLASLLSLLCPAGVQAHEVDAALRAIRFELRDLDPDGGSAPAPVLNLGGQLSAHAWSSHTAAADPSRDYSTGVLDESSTWPRADDQHEAVDVRHRSRAELSAQGGRLRAQLDDRRQRFDLSVSADLTSRDYGASFVAIAAGSSLTLTADSRLALTTVSHCGAGGMCAGTEARTLLSLAIFGRPSIDGEAQTITDSHRLQLYSDVDDPAGVERRQASSEQLSVSFENRSGATVYALLDLQASAYGFAAAPVPEPASWALVLIGAAGVGAAARRSRVSASVERP
ncbi:PEP-CTERM sorting domain-containing protein [Aquabacterium sp. A7-Y]|uniref:PEP-CTERM sorting domain-containing protein n=1 Tax=Aquabacterium sp. A7-Y TaxID=1349605 RepID=UPI00223D9DD5|nr:PEP-CTERM sorting domain-containing protein [Aquabacterium sp. A7-Y]MCW7537355.1 PEP-CTERM sorting domain-containing protein [Aquabacterium sp. A7-Y]